LSVTPDQRSTAGIPIGGARVPRRSVPWQPRVARATGVCAGRTDLRPSLPSRAPAAHAGGDRAQQALAGTDSCVSRTIWGPPG